MIVDGSTSGYSLPLHGCPRKNSIATFVQGILSIQRVVLLNQAMSRIPNRNPSAQGRVLLVDERDHTPFKNQE
jgi:hypothetical protein